jgi:predicted rRNA methylase YqxC with S4 and FtsJ domains
MKCLQCNSTRVVTDVRAVDKGDGDLKNDLRLEVYENPNAWIFKGTQDGKVIGNVCVECGFIMFSMSLLDARKLEKCKNKNT